jgi:hypothetical protein
MYLRSVLNGGQTYRFAHQTAYEGGERCHPMLHVARELPLEKMQEWLECKANRLLCLCVSFLLKSQP